MNQNYSQKLRTIKYEIAEILKKNDIAGSIILADGKESLDSSLSKQPGAVSPSTIQKSESDLATKQMRKKETLT